MTAEETAAALMTQGKGILSTGEVSDVELERMRAHGIESEDAHRAYRELLFTTPGIETHLSAVILSEEAAAETATDGTAFVAHLASKKIIPGIRIGSMDDVRAIFDGGEAAFKKKIEGFASRGISLIAFAVRGDISDAPLSDELSRDIELASNVAKLSIDAGIVPLVELDISQDGAHTASQSEDMLLDIAALLSDAFTKDSIPLQSVIVGASMATSGKDASVKAPADEVAERSVRAATTALPAELAGVVFLSDSQTPEESTENLNALARLEPLPWEIAFCFSRALHEPVLEAWKGSSENLAAAQAALNERLSLLSRADWAGYSKKMETL